MWDNQSREEDQSSRQACAQDPTTKGKENTPTPHTPTQPGNFGVKNHKNDPKTLGHTRTLELESNETRKEATTEEFKGFT